MVDRDVAEGDLAEQAQPAVPGPEVDPETASELGDTVPEADALEQARPVSREPRTPTPSRDLEVPEADALEQAEEIVDDDEDWSRG